MQIFEICLSDVPLRVFGYEICLSDVPLRTPFQTTMILLRVYHHHHHHHHHQPRGSTIFKLVATTSRDCSWKDIQNITWDAPNEMFFNEL